MSWANLKELIFQERKILETASIPEFPQDSAFETQHSALLSCYLKTKSDVDAAIRCFAQTLEWPALSPLERFFILSRLDFAWEVASILNTPYDGESLINFPVSDSVKTAEILEWLLIDIWPYGCGRFLQAQKWISEQGVTARRREATLRPELADAKCVA